MSILVHLAIFLTYAAIAAAVAWRGEVWLADLGLVPPNSGQAWPLAAAIFFGGGLLHEIYARLGRETYLSRQLLSLRHAYAVLLEQQTLVKQEAAALHDAVEAAAVKGGGKPVDEVVAEVKVLQGLVERLYRARTEANDRAPETADIRTAPGEKQSDLAKLLPANDAMLEPASVANDAVALNDIERAEVQKLTPAEPAAVGAESLPQFLTGAKPQSTVTEAKGARALFRRRPKRQAETTAAQQQPAAQLPEGIPSGLLPPVDRSVDDASIIAVLREALREDGIQFVLQPIVSLPQRQKVFYECFSRLRTAEGGTLVPEQYIPIAEREGLITAVDNMLLFRCVQLARKIQRRNNQVDFFCNISLQTLCDTDFFSDFVDFLESNRVLAPNLIFEFTHAALDGWGREEQAQLRRLARLGCRFSVDQVRSLSLDVERLSAKGIAFVKIDAAKLRAAGRRSLDFVSRLEKARIATIVTKIEDEQQLLEVLDFGVSLGQGYLFGEPRLARPAD